MSEYMNVTQAAGAVPASSPGGGTATDIDEVEPVLFLDNIQGNIIGGFNKDFQTLLFLTIDDPGAFKTWLATQIPFISTAEEVMAFNNLFKSVRKRRKQEGHVKATWLNVAFNFAGMALLTEDANLFTDAAFVEGLPSRAASLNDPVDADNMPAGWLIGSSDDEVHVVFIIAADDRGDMLNEVARLTESLTAFEDDKGARVSSGARITFQDKGANLPAPLGAMNSSVRTTASHSQACVGAVRRTRMCLSRLGRIRTIDCRASPARIDFGLVSSFSVTRRRIRTQRRLSTARALRRARDLNGQKTDPIWSSAASARMSLSSTRS
ncbi:MAG: hypothetical protein JWN14_3384 [Chthonomonadales bacterium]|nr:hypothetical protein [Chthonomonadales bacterium]